MQILRRLLLGLLLSVGITAYAQKDRDKEDLQPRILILLDGSSSMNAQWQNGETRFKVASRIILKLIDSIYSVNKNVEFALRVYGHQQPSQLNNCYDTKLEVMFSKDNYTQMSLRLAALHAIGVSPIAFSLQEAAEYDLTDQLRNIYSLILITDGEESCGGNICDVAKRLLSKQIEFKPYVLGLVDNVGLKSQYDCLGDYLTVASEKDLRPSVGKIVEAYRPMLSLTTIQRKILQTTVVKAPSVLNVDVPKFKVEKEVVVTEPVKKEPPPAKPLPKDAVAGKLKPQFLKTVQIYIFTQGFRQIPLPKYTPKTIPDEPVAIPKPPPAPKPVVQPVITAKPATVKTPSIEIVKPKELKREASAETTLQIYFADDNGVYYQTTPEMVLLDMKTKTPVQRFFRTVTSNGSPTPQKLPAGQYYLTFVDKSTLMYDIEIKANQNTAYTLSVSDGSIYFFYEGNSKRPVEYIATVTPRFSNNTAVIRQKCTEEIKYPPGTYLVVINTLPPHKRSFDIYPGSAHGIDIPEEGELIIPNTQNLGKVTLYYPIGDQFRPFHTLVLDGTGGETKLKVLPGTYKAGYKTPGLASGEQTTRGFVITSNNVTTLAFQ